MRPRMREHAHMGEGAPTGTPEGAAHAASLGGLLADGDVLGRRAKQAATKGAGDSDGARTKTK